MSFTNLSGGDLSAIPRGRIVHLAVIGDTLYAAGRIINDLSNPPFVMSYDSTNHMWNNLPGGDLGALPNATIFTILAVGETLYVGGVYLNTITHAPVVMSYDSTNNIWKNLSGGDLFLTGYVSSLVAIGGTLYAGGRDYATQLPFVMSYDSTTHMWENLSGGDLGGLSYASIDSLASIGNTLYAGGSHYDSENDVDLPFVMSYDSSNKIWKNLSGGDLGGLSDGGIVSFATIGNTLYAGGRYYMNAQMPFVISYDSSNQIWKNLSGGDLGGLSNASIKSLASIGNTLYAGGSIGSSSLPLLMSYDSTNQIWKNLSGGDLGAIHRGYVNNLAVRGNTLYVGGYYSVPNTPFVMSYSLSSSVVPVDTHIPCFLANAPVLTPTGYTKMSALAEGDTVLTGDGRVVAIQRVLHTYVAAGPSANPYVIPKGTFGATARLLISPNHRVSTEQGFVEARLLGLQQEEMTDEIEYYNLELPSWTQDTMVVAGVVVESLAPVRRATMTLGEFKKALVAQYGELTPAVLEKVQKTCRLLCGGRVECPVLAT